MKGNPVNSILKKGLPAVFGLLALFYAPRCRAQDDTDHSVADTAIVAPPDVNVDSAVLADSEASSSYEEAPDEEVKPHPVPDTPAFRAVPDTVAARLRKEKDFAYANDPSYWKKEKKKPEPDHSGSFASHVLLSGVLRMLMYGLLIAVLLFAVYRIIVVNNLYVFYSPRKKNAADAEEPEPDIEAHDLDDKITKALQLEDHRIAVRYMYLKALQALHRRGWIQFHPEGTNYEYISQANRFPAGKDFQQLTRVYEYVWYGEFGLSKEQAQTVLRHFTRFYNTVSN